MITNLIEPRIGKLILNTFSTNVPLLYPLKISEHLRFSDVFRECRSGTLVENGLIIWFEITIQNSAMYFWKVTFSNWLDRTICTFFLGSRFQNHPDSVILKKYQPLSNQSFKHNSMQMPCLILKLSFEPRYRMYIINAYYTKSLLSLDSLFVLISWQFIAKISPFW